MDVLNALATLDALSNETRLWAFRLLVQAGPEGLPAGEIAERLSLRQNTMSSHLNHLNPAGLIASRRSGRRIVYTANYGTVKGLVLFLMQDCCAGSHEVCRPVAQTLAGASQI
jgi:ArsR family transcriptional regulator